MNWDFLGAELLDRLTTKETNEVHRMKQSAKTTYLCYLASGREYYRDISYEIALNVNCLSWYANRIDKWKAEHERKTIKGLYQYLIAFETYEHTEQLKLFEVAPAPIRI